MFLLVGFFASAAQAFAPPAMTGHVTDPAGKLSGAERQALIQKLSDYRKCSTNQIGIFIPDSLAGEAIEDVAYQTFNGWGMGIAGHDNGVLLLVAPAERKVRIEVGKGLAGALPDLRANDILREHVSPHMKRDEIFLALDEGTTEIGRALGGCAIGPASIAPATSSAPAPRPAAPVVLPPPPRQVDEHLPARVVMGLVVAALVAAVVRGRRVASWLSIIVGLGAAIVFSIFASAVSTTHEILKEPTFDFDTMLGIFVFSVVGLLIANFAAWRFRRYDHGQFEPTGGGGSTTSGSTTSFDSSFTSSSSTSSTSSTSSNDTSFTGGGGRSGGAGSSDSY